MSPRPGRPLRDRVLEYSINLRAIANQLQVIVDAVEAARPDTNPGTQELRDSIRLHRLIADDIDKILRGEELQKWAITGTLPTDGTEPQP